MLGPQITSVSNISVLLGGRGRNFSNFSAPFPGSRHQVISNQWVRGMGNELFKISARLGRGWRVKLGSGKEFDLN